jgi:FdrA protein
MAERIVVHRGSYRDSAFLMRVTRELKAHPGVAEAVVLMGTPMNLELLGRAGFMAVAAGGAGPLDMVVALRGDEPAALDAAEVELERLLQGGGAAGDRDLGADAAVGRSGTPPRLRSLSEAAALHPDARLVSVSVPGEYAAFVAHRALDAGRHVFLFSNNVDLADEIALKRRGRDAGLLVMGPDCGTAIIAGVGLGFANRVPRGPVGIVGASGTGIQEVSALLAGMDVGVSHAIGTGSRDLSADVGGIMTEMGLRLLADDPATEVLVLVAKHPAAEVAAAMHAVLRSLGKPAVVRYLGKPPRESGAGVYYAADLDETAQRAAALAGARVEVERQPEATSPSGPTRRFVGLFGGGSLAAEAEVIFRHHGISVTVPDHPLAASVPLEGSGHLMVDTGEDFYTVGKPHPMVDQTVRCALLEAAAADPAVSLILIDLVLGDGAHLDPAPEIAAALAAGRARRGSNKLVCVASVCGTSLDPQDARRQRAVLVEAGVMVMRSAAQAARTCALGLNAASHT